MDFGIELMLDEPGCLNAPIGFLEDIKKYSMKAINHQKGSIDMDMMLGKNYEVEWYNINRVDKHPKI